MKKFFKKFCKLYISAFLFVQLDVEQGFRFFILAYCYFDFDYF